MAEPNFSTLRLEPLLESHISAILEIERVANSAPWSEKSFQNELDNPDKVFLVALVSGKVVAYGGVWLIIDESHVTNIAVSEEFRSKGIGRRLMVQLLETSKDLGMTCSTLEVRASNEPAIQMYQKLGYSETARRKRYYPDNHEDAIVMWLYDLQAWEPPRRISRA